jgi:hypothetical protein
MWYIIGIVLMAVGGYQIYKLSKYEFEHRTGGGAVEFKTFNSAIGHTIKRTIFVLILCAGVFIFLFQLVK